MATITELSKNLALYRNNPVGLFQEVINLVEAQSNGETQVLSASTPFALALEMMTSLGSAAMTENDNNLRKQYKSLTQSTEELSLWMSDRDYLGIFSTAAMATFKFLFRVDTVRSKAVSLGSESNVRKLIIPKHSQFEVDGVSFCMQYPVEVIVLPHNGITVQYGESEVSPLYSTTNNQLSTRFIDRDGDIFMEISIPVTQAKINTHIASLNAAISLNKTISYTDKYLYTRAYIKNEYDNNWSEIRVIHNNEVYDPIEPTVCLTVGDEVLSAYVPQIYFENGLIKDTIRFDVYTTKGELSMVMSNYSLDAYKGIWIDLDTTTTSRYSAPIQTMAVDIYSGETVNGGTNGTDYKTLRKQIINGKRKDDEFIITPTHLETEFNDDGFDLVTNIDNITDRQYLATKPLPSPTNDSTITGVGTTVSTLQLTINQLLQNQYCKNNGARTTILPKVLYIKDNGVVRPIPDTILNNLTDGSSFTLEGLVNHVNSADYLYSPFTYVLETDIDYFNIRPYYLNSPKISSVYLNKVNNEVGVTAGITAYNLTRDSDDTGYTLDIQIEGGGVFNSLGYENLALQVSYGEYDGGSRVFLDGTLISQIDTRTNAPVDNKYIYRFHINTNFDINSKNQLILTPSNTAIPLSGTLDVVLVVKDYLPENATLSSIDKIVNFGTLPNYIYTSNFISTHRFKMDIVLGEHLENLWTRGRTLISDDQYERYTENVYYTYDEDVPKWVNGRKVYDIVDGKLVTVIEHRAGERILDEYNNPSIRYHAGDVKIDPVTKEKIISAENNDLLREFDLVLFDGLYYFANASATVDYLKEAMDTIITWSKNNIPRLGANLIDRSDLKFHPKTTIGDVTLIGDNGEEIKVSAYQDITITYYLSEEKFANAELRKYITEHTPSVINEAISKTTVAKSDITDALKTVMGDDILGVNVSGFMDDKYNIITVKDASQLPCIGKRLVINNNLTLQVEDRITINPIKHI